jgi:hypothetical protein
MVELTVTLAIGMIILGMAYRFMTGTRFHFMHGTVNLQNLSEVRSAINFLRRDFASACPYLSPADNPVHLMLARNRPFNNPPWADALNSKLVQIDADGKQILFYRFLFEPNQGSSLPKVQEVKYEFDATAKVLVRTVEGKRTVFQGFEGVEFKFFLNETNDKTPILRVKLLAHEGKDKGFGQADLGKPVELTTSIVSQFMHTFYSNKTWNFSTCHEK